MICFARFLIGMRVLGIVENMSDIRIPLSAAEAASDIKFVDSYGNDVGAKVLQRIKEVCPEILDTYLLCPLFKANTNGHIDGESRDCPALMAQRFGVPYLGKLPMDTNMMKACEDGKSFLEAFPTSPAAQPLKEIVSSIVRCCES